MRTVLAVALLLVPVGALAQAPSFTGHYPVGIEGIKGGSVPPPGLYVRDYSVFYFSSDYPEGPPEFDLFAFINAPRVIWITPLEILGANFGLDVIPPFGYVNLEYVTPDGKVAQDDFTLGDIAVEPAVLAWHFDRLDLAVGYAFWAPTGEHEEPTQLGKGFWSQMGTAGITFYPDAEKTFALSALNRYEFAQEHDDSGITPGQTYTLEWGASSALGPYVQIGIVGYWQQQTTRDSGTDRDTGADASDVRDYVVGVGPEILALVPQVGLFASLRWVHEVAAKDRPQGDTFTITLTYRF